MSDAVKAYLEAHGYTNICIDFMPDEKNVPEAIYLGVWRNDLGGDFDGSSTRYTQIQVRRRDGVEARNVCDTILTLLDSGFGEDKIWLTDVVWCIGRPTQGAVVLTRGNNTMTYYANVSLWGEA